MYATPHTAIGIGILCVFPEKPILGITCAIISHFFLDFIDEEGLDNIDRIRFDYLPSMIMLLASFVFGHFWLFLFGNIAANLFDLIDKKLYLAVFKPQKYKATKWFHFQKQIIFPSVKTTKIVAWLSAIFVIILFISTPKNLFSIW